MNTFDKNAQKRNYLEEERGSSTRKDRAEGRIVDEGNK